MELAIFLIVLTGAAALLAARRDRVGLGLAAACVALGLLGAGLWRPGGDPTLDRSLPAPREDDAYATSDACRACHPQAWSAWHRSFHRTMTQRATPASVLGNFDDVTLSSRGFTTRLERSGDEFWADVPDPLWFVDPSEDKPAKPPRIHVRVVMTTGSHHLQNYWIRRPSEGPVYRDKPDNGALVQIPWVWEIEAGRWIPVQDSFLTPPMAGLDPPQVWNSACHGCHAVGAQPRLTGDTFDTRSAELGIACEACHGPGEEHVQANLAPWRRYARHFSSDGDPTIVNPARLPSRRAADVCGQCHSFSGERDSHRVTVDGSAYHPGEDLNDTRSIFRYFEDPRSPALEEYLALDPGSLESAFWPDGTMRVTGREYNALIESGCYQRGELSCLSCHSMHRYAEPADQLAPDAIGDAACLACHEDFSTRVAAHTRHALESAGSRCDNCHMPHTTFGLFGAMRSHRVDSPSVTVSAETGRPNACNLCHLDRSLSWAAEHLTDWYGQPAVVLDAQQRELAAGVLWSVKGDAVQRAIAGWHMGWEPAQRASGRKWMGAYLAVLLADPYLAVRRVAQRSLSTLDGFAAFEFDFVASQEVATKKLVEAAGRWNRAMAGAPDRSGPHLLLNEGGEMDDPALRRLLSERDNRPVRIVE
jgi:hypothetical protein